MSDHNDLIVTVIPRRVRHKHSTATKIGRWKPVHAVLLRWHTPDGRRRLSRRGLAVYSHGARQ